MSADTTQADAARILLLALPETTPGALYSLYEVFSSVGVTWSALTGEPPAGRRIEVAIVGAGPVCLGAAGPIVIMPQLDLPDAGPADAIVITDLDLAADCDPRGRWPLEVRWLRAQYEAGALVSSVCTGSVFLAEAGLLDGQEATSHWSMNRLIQRCYPKVRLRSERILCPAGDAHRIVTAGGATSWEDLALHLVARFSGTTEALRTARIFVLGDRSEGQLPYAAALRSTRQGDAVIAACQAWVAEHYDAPNPVTGMIRHCGLAERTFKRRFKEATGYSPLEYVQTLRVEEAKHLLETTALPTDAIAEAVGYDDSAFFRRLFRRHVGVTPARYRRRVQSILTRAGAYTSQGARDTAGDTSVSTPGVSVGYTPHRPRPAPYT